MRLAVVGAGIVGLLSAVEAAKRGARVDLYEESRGPGRGASGHNAGVIHVLQPPFINRKARLARRANRLYDRLAGEAGFSLLRLPGLLLYSGGRGRALAVAAAAALRILGYPVRLVGPGVVRDLCPSIEARHDGAVLVEGYATLVPWEALKAIEGLAESLGVELHYRARVEGVEPAAGGRGPRLLLADAYMEYDSVIVAAGGDTTRLAAAAGLRPPRVGYFKGVMAFTRLECNAVAAGLVSSRRSRMTKGGGVIPWPDGRVLLGPTFKAASNPWDTSYEAGELEEAASAYRDILGFKPRVEGGLAGTRVKNLDRDDFYTAAARGIVFLGAIDSPGFTSAPLLAAWAVGRALSYARGR